MIIILVPVLAAVIGVLIYALATNPKLIEIGRLLFFAGVLAALLLTTPHLVRLP